VNVRDQEHALNGPPGAASGAADRARDGAPAVTTPQVLLSAQRFRVETVYRADAAGNVRQREVVRHPGAVTIVPLVADQHVCLIRNYRVAVARTLIELPAGTLEPPEDPQVTAARELQEETGYRAGQLTPIHAFYLSPGILDERMHLYLATQLTPGEARREAGEEIENLIVPWPQAIQWVRTGTIEDAKTIVGLLLCEALRRDGRLPAA
jgi:ADP-ribose pyrophosphatase